MSHYVVAQLNITDRDEYAKYEAGFMDVFSTFNGTMLSVDEAPVVLEGEWAFTRTVLIRFPSADDALAWYQSGAYQDLARHRFAASSANVVVVAGL